MLSAPGLVKDKEWIVRCAGGVDSGEPTYVSDNIQWALFLQIHLQFLLQEIWNPVFSYIST